MTHLLLLRKFNKLWKKKANWLILGLFFVITAGCLVTRRPNIVWKDEYQDGYKQKVAHSLYAQGVSVEKIKLVMQEMAESDQRMQEILDR